MRKTVRVLTILTAVFILFPLAVTGQDVWDYVLNADLEALTIPKAYTVERVISHLGIEDPFLDQPEDLYVSEDGRIYIADSNNNRIIRMSADFTVEAVFDGGESPLHDPKGVYVDADGDMYIADTGNSRIAHLGPDGSFVEEFVKPDSELLSDEYEFKPVKVYIDSIGYLYIINENDYHGFITMDSQNRFRGYVAPTKLEFNFTQLLLETFASEEQKEKLSRRLPPYHSNFLIKDDGFIYATTVFTERDQIKKINSVGVNNYSSKIEYADTLLGIPIGTYSYFGQREIDGEAIVPMFVDLHVDDRGIITAVDSTTQRIYQYDQEGQVLAVFGDKGNRKGEFRSVSSIAGDRNGRLYILDRDGGNIQVFEPTNFIDTVHRGIELQFNGRYERAMTEWESVLAISPNYYVAQNAMGKISAKVEEWEDSMEFYEEGEDKAGYSQSFSEFRHNMFRRYFFLVVVAIVITVFVVTKLVLALKKVADQILYKIVHRKESV